MISIESSFWTQHGFGIRKQAVAQLCYSVKVHNVVFSQEALRLFSKLRKADRAFIKEGVQVHLAEGDPKRTSRNKFRLRRPSPHADYELRLDQWLVFYRLRDDSVEVVLIGEKRGNKLIIGNEEFSL